jgi:hypothetical protein
MNGILAAVVAGSDFGKGIFLMAAGVIFVFAVQVIFYFMIKIACGMQRKGTGD